MKTSIPAPMRSAYPPLQKVDGTSSTNHMLVTGNANRMASAVVLGRYSACNSQQTSSFGPFVSKLPE